MQTPEMLNPLKFISGYDLNYITLSAAKIL